MNNTVHRSINQYPSVMLFGIAQRGKIVDSLKENVIDKEQRHSNTTVKEIRGKAEEVQKRVQNYNKSYVDGKRQNPRIYKEGDYVMIRNFNSTTGVSSKLLPRFKGPFRICKVLDNDRYCVKDVEGFQQTQRPYEGIWAVQNMKPWLKGDERQTVEDDVLEEQNSDSDKNSVVETDKNERIGQRTGVTTRGMLTRSNMVGRMKKIA